MKKSIALLLVFMLLILALGGCGSAETTDKIPSSTSEGASSEVSTDETSEKSAGEDETSLSGELSFLCWYTQDRFQPILDAFNERYPNIEIDFQNVPSENNQYNQRITLLASSGELPDLFYQGPPVDQMAKNGYLAPLDDIEVVKKLPETYKRSFSYEGNTYVYGCDSWVGGIFYNIDLMEEYNLEIPTTWDEFIANCKVLYDAGIKPLSMSSSQLPDIINWLHCTEVLIKDPDFNYKINTGEKTFEEGYLEAMKIWKRDIVDTGYLSKDSVGYSDEQRNDEFAMGEAAMIITGPWALSQLREKNPDLNFGIMPFVGLNGDQYANGAVNVGIAMSANAKNKENAIAFINFMGEEETLKMYQGITGNFLGADVDYELDPALEPLRPFAESGNFAFPNIMWTNFSTLDPMYIKLVQEVVLGVKTPEDVVREMDAKQQELMAEAQ